MSRLWLTPSGPALADYTSPVRWDCWGQVAGRLAAASAAQVRSPGDSDEAEPST